MQSVDAMDGITFEKFCAELLEANKFTGVCVTQSSGDYGVDVLAYKGNTEYAIQCKNYSSHVGNSAVQEAYSGKAYYDCQKAVVMTNNYFTAAAIETARKIGVELWDRNKLYDMIAVKRPDLRKLIKRKKISETKESRKSETKKKKNKRRRKLSRRTRKKIRNIILFLIFVFIVATVIVSFVCFAGFDLSILKAEKGGIGMIFCNGLFILKWLRGLLAGGKG